MNLKSINDGVSVVDWSWFSWILVISRCVEMIWFSYKVLSLSCMLILGNGDLMIFIMMKYCKRCDSEKFSWRRSGRRICSERGVGRSLWFLFLSLRILFLSGLLLFRVR